MVVEDVSIDGIITREQRRNILQDLPIGVVIVEISIDLIMLSYCTQYINTCKTYPSISSLMLRMSLKIVLLFVRVHYIIIFYTNP